MLSAVGLNDLVLARFNRWVLYKTIAGGMMTQQRPSAAMHSKSTAPKTKATIVIKQDEAPYQQRHRTHSD